jgi:CRP/FNR family transcriptional regulator, cyclic AMP receptor protein
MNALEVQTLARYWELMAREAASSDDRARVLATFPLFSGVGKRRLRKLVRDATFLELAPGETIVAGDAPGDSLYVILGGRAKTRWSSPSRTLHVGDYFGELSVLSGSARSTTFVATRELHLMRLPRTSFLRLARQEPAVSLAMLTDHYARFRGLELEAARS